MTTYTEQVDRYHTWSRLDIAYLYRMFVWHEIVPDATLDLRQCDLYVYS